MLVANVCCGCMHTCMHVYMLACMCVRLCIQQDYVIDHLFVCLSTYLSTYLSSAPPSEAKRNTARRVRVARVYTLYIARHVLRLLHNKCHNAAHISKAQKTKMSHTIQSTVIKDTTTHTPIEPKASQYDTVRNQINRVLKHSNTK